jgi:putative transposase
MSWVRVYIHVVFTTKNKEPFLDTVKKRIKVFKHIKENALEKGIWLDSVGGYDDHAHCLISLKGNVSISDTVRLIKGESSNWINKNIAINGRFEWQDDYWAVGVSEKHVPIVRNYIFNQEDHHKNNTFQEEIETIFKK